MLKAPSFTFAASKVFFDHRLIQEHFQVQNTPVPTDAQITVLHRELDGQKVPEVVITSRMFKRVIHVTRSAKSTTGWAQDESKDTRYPQIPRWHSCAVYLSGKGSTAEAPVTCLVYDYQYCLALEKHPAGHRLKQFELKSSTSSDP